MRTNCPVTVLFFQEDLRRCWPHVTRRACTGCSLFVDILLPPLRVLQYRCIKSSFFAMLPRNMVLPLSFLSRRLSPWTLLLSPLSPMRRRGNNLFYRRLSQICPVDTRPELIIILDLGARVVARNIF